MQLRFYANMRTIVGMSSLEIEDGQAHTFRKLLAFLVEKYPETAFHLLDADGNLRQNVPVYVDGRNPRLKTVGLDAPLQADSVVSFFSPIASGKMNVEVLREPTFGKQE
jgi:molybdopterin converting factor small subunit